jgi:hypothetical protein
MVFFMTVGEPSIVVNVENMNVLDAYSLCPKAKLNINISLPFTFPGQEDGHGTWHHEHGGRELALAEIILKQVNLSSLTRLVAQAIENTEKSGGVC